ncbi:hypothetical protein GS3922_09990 [Geobacillus subterraneus]|uniref:Uncharacterized protein n=2 Tax=Geobacillus TaxID=129337 RepID=A0ABN4NH10_9BACL|nr:hypothetical protein GS3922_09990 [Geobacillus subterraneus]KZS26749.1 hypothetical protein A5418_13600 [Geobacillus subterraneus]OXB88162.1 hypothetical protein B9L21_09875 [Geobacillus uzenensis]
MAAAINEQKSVLSGAFFICHGQRACKDGLGAFLCVQAARNVFEKASCSDALGNESFSDRQASDPRLISAAVRW